MAYLKEMFFDKAYGAYGKRVDTYKDVVSGRGLLERLTRAIYAVSDDVNEQNILNLIALAVSPKTALNSVLPVLEAGGGVDLVLGADEVTRRRVLLYYRSLVAIKGTKRCFEILLKWAGFRDVSVNYYTKDYGFDSLFTLDDTERVLDSGGGCGGCWYFDIVLKRPLVTAAGDFDDSFSSDFEIDELVPDFTPLTDTEYKNILAIVSWASPVGASFRGAVIAG